MKRDKRLGDKRLGDKKLGDKKLGDKRIGFTSCDQSVRENQPEIDRSAYPWYFLGFVYRKRWF
jgi:hypothetical protein